MQQYNRRIASISLLVVLGLVSLTGAQHVAVAAATTTVAPALDGTASNGCGYAQTCSVSLTTAQANDVVIVGCNCWPGGVQFLVKDSAGLTFHLRSPQLAIGGGNFVETWYAVSSSVLRADKISVSTNQTGETWFGVLAFAVSGANTAVPFVGGLPDIQANIQCRAPPCNEGVTAPAGSFLFQFGGSTGGTIQTAGPGMTLIAASNKGASTFAQYEVLSSSVTGVTLSFGRTSGSDFGVVADAINPVGATGGITVPTGPLGTEMVIHAFAASCAPLTIPTMTVRWDSTPVPVGSDAWQVELAISDSVHNETLVAALTTINGQHNFTVSFYQGSTLTSRQVSPVPSNVAFPGNFGQQEFTDFYYTGSQITFFWYAPHAAFIMVSQSLNVPRITPTDAAVFFAPLQPAQPLQFSFFQDSYFMVGQDAAGPQIAGAVNHSPCATPLSLHLSNNIDTNACEDAFTAAASTLDETMISEPIGQ
jgi:hypothetical protein